MARAGQPPKVDRNTALIEYRDKHPEVSFETLGRIFGGISKQAAWAIYQRGNEKPHDRQG